MHMYVRPIHLCIRRYLTSSPLSLQCDGSASACGQHLFSLVHSPLPEMLTLLTSLRACGGDTAMLLEKILNKRHTTAFDQR